MFFFQLRLALNSLRRTPFYTATSVVGLAIGVSVFITAWTVVNMAWKNSPPATPGLYHVQIDRPKTFEAPRYAHLAKPFPSLLLPHRDAASLLEMDTPARKTATFTSSLVIARDGAPRQLVRGRFCTRDFFGLFELEFEEGGPWDAESEAGFVLSSAAKARLFGDGPAVGRRLRVEGTEGVIRGVVAVPRVARIWDLGIYQEPLEAVFVPFARAAVLQPDPDAVFGPESDRSFTLFWVELPDAARRAAFEAQLAEWVKRESVVERGAPPIGFVLRDVPTWMAQIIAIDGPFEVWMISSWLVLFACTLNAARMLLAKFLSRAHEVGLHRIFGASRTSIFTQHFLEAMLLGVAGAGAGLALSAVLFPLLRLSVPDITAPIGLDLKAILVTFAAALGSAAVAGLFPAWRISGIRPSAYVRRQ